MPLIRVNRPWYEQPLDRGIVRDDVAGVVSVWDGRHNALLTPNKNPAGVYAGSLGVTDVHCEAGFGRGGWSTGTGEQPYNLPAGSFGLGSAGTRIAIVRMPTGTGTYNLSSTDTNGMQIRVTGGSSLVFVKRAVSARITATSAFTQGEVCVVAASFGTENRIYKNGALLGADSGNLVTTQPSACFIGSDSVTRSADFGNGVLLFHAALDRQMTHAEISEMRTPAEVWNFFLEPDRIRLPQEESVIGLPTLSLATLVNAGGNNYQPRVTYTY